MVGTVQEWVEAALLLAAKTKEKAVDEGSKRIPNFIWWDYSKP